MFSPCLGYGCASCASLFFHGSSWLPVPGLWAGFYLVFLCPSCGLELFMVGMMVDMLGYPVCGVWFWWFCIGLMPLFPMILGEVMSVCCLLWYPFWLRVLLLIVCLAIDLFGKKILNYLKTEKKKPYFLVMWLLKMELRWTEAR